MLASFQTQWESLVSTGSLHGFLSPYLGFRLQAQCELFHKALLSFTAAATFLRAHTFSWPFGLLFFHRQLTRVLACTLASKNQSKPENVDISNKLRGNRFINSISIFNVGCPILPHQSPLLTFHLDKTQYPTVLKELFFGGKVAQPNLHHYGQVELQCHFNWGNPRSLIS